MQICAKNRMIPLYLSAVREQNNQIVLPTRRWHRYSYNFKNTFVRTSHRLIILVNLDS